MAVRRGRNSQSGRGKVFFNSKDSGQELTSVNPKGSMKGSAPVISDMKPQLVISKKPLPAQVSPPAMREVRKGWWTSSERRVKASDFELEDRKIELMDRKRG